MEYIVETEQGNEEAHFIDAKTGILKKVWNELHLI